MGLKIQDKKKPLQKAAFMAAKNYLAAGAAGAAAGAVASAAGAAAGADASAAGAGATTGAGAATGASSFLPQAARAKAAAMATRTRDLFIF